MKVKYIYFEIYSITGREFVEPKIQKENGLMFKPHTNSNGIWIFTNVTERKGFTLPTFVYVEQYWIDLDKYKFKLNNSSYHIKLDSYIEKCMNKFDNKEI